MGERACRRESPTISEGKPRHDFSPDSEIGTTDSTDFTDFEEVIGDVPATPSVARVRILFGRDEQPIFRACWKRIEASLLRPSLSPIPIRNGRTNDRPVGKNLPPCSN